MIPLLPAFAPIKYLWVINGISLSVLWPALIRLLAETLSAKHMARASMLMGTTVATGTFFVYGTSALFSLFSNFKWSFYTAAIALLAIALIWILFSGASLSAQKSAVHASRQRSFPSLPKRTTAV